MDVLSQEKIIARDKYLTSIADHKDLVEKYSEWLNLSSTNLADLRMKRKEINVCLKEKGITKGEREMGVEEIK